MKDIPGYEGKYAATSCGKIWSYRRNRFLKSCGEKDNYQIVNLCDKGSIKTCYVHRLVAMTYLPNPDNLPEINHIDKHKDNNCLSNLEWCTRNYNMAYNIGKENCSIYCVELDKTFSCAKEVADFMNRHVSNLYGHLNISCPKTFAGYHWRYNNS